MEETSASFYISPNVSSDIFARLLLIMDFKAMGWRRSGDAAPVDIKAEGIGSITSGTLF